MSKNCAQPAKMDVELLRVLNEFDPGQISPGVAVDDDILGGDAEAARDKPDVLAMVLRR